MMLYKNKYIFLQTLGRILLSLLLTTMPIKAEERFGFEALTTEDGLLSSFVYSIAEDHDGFMWIGGANGLQRFDGNEFRTFLHISEDKTSLSNNVINCLLVDHNGDIWVGTNNGLNLYVQDQEKFQLIQLNARTENFFDINKIKALLQTDNGMIWIGTAFGLSRYDIEQQQATHYKHPEISVIQPLDAHNLIIGTRNAGLYKFNTLNATFTALNSTAIDLSTTGIRDISKQPRDQYLIATWGKGVLNYHSQTETISMTDFNLPDPYTLQILSDGTGSYWIASSTGLHRLNLQKSKSEYHIQLEIDDTDNDVEKRIRSLYQSKDGNIWITTSGYGLFRYYINSNQFEYYVPNKMDELGLQDKVVIDFSESSDGRIYLAKLSGNIAIFDKDKKTFQHLSFLKHGKPFKKIINAVAALSNEELLISSGQETFRARTDLPVQEITTSKQYPLLKQMSLIRINQNINPPIILSATSQQLHLLNINPAGDLYIQNSFPYRSSRMVSYFVTPWQDVYAADEEGEVIKIENYKAPSPNITIIRKRDNFYIDSIAVDNNKNLWIANEGSKLIVQPENKPAFFYDIQRENATGFGALQYLPTSNQLWLTTTQGLSSINLNDDTINHYDELDGLQKNLMKPERRSPPKMAHFISVADTALIVFLLSKSVLT